MNRSDFMDKALTFLGGLAVIAIVAGVVAAITLTHSWVPVLRIAGFGVTEHVRVPSSQCEEIRGLMDADEYTVACVPGESDKEFVADLLRRCAEGFGGAFVVLADNGRLYEENLCETEQEVKDAAKLKNKKISDEDAEAFIAIYTAEPDGTTQ